jgi:hypothetical protein
VGPEFRHVAKATRQSLKKGSGFPEKVFRLKARTAPGGLDRRHGVAVVNLPGGIE